MNRLIFPICFTMVLASCGDRAGALDQTRDLLRNAMESRQQARPSAEAIEVVDGPLILATLPERNASTGLVPLQRNGDVATWSGGNGITISYHQGVLTATRGLGGDLISADLVEVHRAIRQGDGRAVRVHRYLDGEEQLQAHAFVCDYTRIGQLIVEGCVGAEIRFENQYELDKSDQIRNSLQWVSASVGYLRSEVLKEQ